MCSIPTNKNSEKGFWVCNTREAGCDVFNFPFRGKSDKLSFGGAGTHCSTNNSSRDNEQAKSKFLKMFLDQSQSVTNEIETEKARINPFAAWTCGDSFGWKELSKNWVLNFFGQFYSTVKEQHFHSLQQKNPVIPRLWTEVYYTFCIRSRPRYHKKLLRKSSANMELVVVAKAKTFAQSFGQIAIILITQRPVEMREEVFHRAGA